MERRYVTFTIEGHAFAVPLAAARRTLRAVWVAPLPAAPRVILGAINLHGRLVPVVNLRRRLNLPERPLDATARLLLVETPLRQLALAVDEVEGVTAFPASDISPRADVWPGLSFFDGMVLLGDRIVLIHDLERLLTSAEEEALNGAVASADRAPGPGEA